MAVSQTYKDATIAIATGVGAPTVPDYQASDLDAAGFAALTWTTISKCGNVGNWQTTQNIISYDTVDVDTSQKQGGVKNAGDPNPEFAYDKSDNGQNAMVAAAQSPNYAAFRVTLATGDLIYSRGKVAGGEGFGGGGGVEDFVVRQFQIGLVQTPVEV
tara:strand:+ start:7647 stop:8120 length:474 start_codon:yes stop_codon:yes gene_type:complete